MLKKQISKVMIVGGGVSGISTSLFLHKYGIQSKVYETHPYKEGVGGGLNIASNGMKVLKELDLSETLIQKGTVSKFAYFHDEKLKMLSKLPYGDPSVYEQPSVSMKRSLLVDTLTQKSKEQNLSIEYNKKVQSITEKEDSVVLHFSDGTVDEGDILIGADGHHSICRKHLFPNGPNPSYVGIIGIGGFVSKNDFPNMLSLEDEYALHYVFGPKGFFGYGGFGVDVYGWWVNYHKDNEFTKEELYHFDEEQLKKELLEQFKDYDPIVTRLIEKTELKDLSKQNVFDILSLPYWHKNRIMLIGDAAHTVSPNSGQGASLSLEDSYLIANLLANCNGDYEKAFKEFQSLRKDRCEKVVLEGRKRAKGKEIVSPFQSKVRNFFMKYIFRALGTKMFHEALSYKVPIKNESNEY